MYASRAAPCLPFLQFGEEEYGSLDKLSWRAAGREAARVEFAMAGIADGPAAGRGRLRIAVVSNPPECRTIYSARENVAGTTTLAQTLSAVDGRSFVPEDIVFLLAEDGLGSPVAHDQDALHLAIHNVALLIAVGAPPSARDTLYLSAALVVTACISVPSHIHESIADGFLRMWLRDRINPGGDPPAWNAASMHAVRLRDPLEGAFMAGLGDAIATLPHLRIPAALPDIAEVAGSVEAQAMLGLLGVAGSA